MTGIFSGTTSAINTFIGVIETIANGTQTGVTYVSSLSTFASKKVFVRSFNWNYIQGSPLKINYTLELVEGA